MTEINCPACGHHLFTTTTDIRPAPTTAREVMDRGRSEGDSAAARWLATVSQGTYTAGELYRRFTEDTDVRLSQKGLAQALLDAGATPRRGTAGVRLWQVK